MRTAGNGIKILILQFLKGSWHYGELGSIAALGTALGTVEDPAIVIRQMGRGFVKVGGAETDPEDLKMVEDAWAESAAAILSGDWDLVVLDEIDYTIGYKMLDPQEVANVLASRTEMVHVILTGRNAPPFWSTSPILSPRCEKLSTPIRRASSRSAVSSSDRGSHSGGFVRQPPKRRRDSGLFRRVAMRQ